MQSQRDAAFAKAEVSQKDSITELIGDLANQSAGLVRDEVALAKQEVSEKLVSLRSAVVTLAIGGFVGLVGAFALAAAAIAGLANYMELWQAALVVGGGLALLAVIVGVVGLGQLKRVNLKPEVTIKSLEEDKQWLKEIT
jgi:hypothetical protein